MSEMRDKVAEAIYLADPLVGTEFGKPLEFAKIPKFMRELAYLRADAAITALREPTEEMILAGYGAVCDDHTVPKEVFQAMIELASGKVAEATPEKCEHCKGMTAVLDVEGKVYVPCPLCRADYYRHR